ncbi:hypothetical protein [uncultured Lutibacter sp.]|uniref:hypothetical protein n=1 Tax=uncultured Lutibacter sp. TaxID=437739 RepID=UPI0026107FD1|nr:hypothetical protein [uncultured Lutibacter sp.]
MKKLDVKKIKLPLTKKKYKKLRDAIRTRQVKWMDMSTDLMYAYQDFWRFQRYKELNNE